MDVARPEGAIAQTWRQLLADADRYEFEFIEEVIAGGTNKALVHGASEMSSACASAAKRLADRGADLVVGECGFTVRYKAAMGTAANVPVAVSSLQLLPLLSTLLMRNQKIGVMTFEAAHLSTDVFQAAWPGYRPDAVLVDDISDTETWRQTYAADDDNSVIRDVDVMRRDVLEAGRRLMRKDHAIQFVLLECTIMFPFAHQLHAELGVPVFQLSHLTNMIMSSIVGKDPNLVQ